MSIIVPIYNVEKYLTECIESIINQSYKGLEVLLINDGSTDRSGDICDRYATIDKRIKVFHTPNKGLSEARNKGIDNACGDYIMFVDGDDFIKSNSVYDIVNILSKSKDIDILTGKMIHYYESNKVIEEGFSIPEERLIDKSGEEVLTYYFNDIKDIIWSACRSIYGRNYMVENGFRFTPNLTSEDLDLVPLIYLRAKKVRAYNIPFYYYRRIREESIINTHNSQKYIDIIHIINKYEKLINNNNYSFEFKRALIKRLSNIYLNYYILIEQISDNQKEEVLRLYNKKRYLLKTSSGFKSTAIKLIMSIFGVEKASKLYLYIKTKK